MICFQHQSRKVSILLTLLSSLCVINGFTNGVQPNLKSPLDRITLSRPFSSSAQQLNLYNPTDTDATEGRRTTRKSSTLLTAIPEIDNWRILASGSVQGFVKKHPTIPDGDIITTSPLQAPNAVSEKMIVTTGSGSKYKLMQALKKDDKGSTVTVNKRMSTSRKSPSVNISGKVPLLDDWKLLDNDSVQGYVFNHPVIPDGQIISTSTLKNPRSASPKAVVNTISGSRYRLGEPELSPAQAAAAAAAAKSAAPAPKQSSGGGMFGFFGSPAPAPVKKEVASSSPAPSLSVKVTPAPSEKDLAKEFRAKRAKATREYGLNGESLGEDSQYLLAGQPIKSTSGKSLIFKAYRSDNAGLPMGNVEKDSITVKVSSNNQSIEREAGNYQTIAQSGINRGQFVELYDYLPEDKMNSNIGRSKKQCALVMERGVEDLKTYLAKKRVDGGLSGKELREAASAAIQCIQAAHSSGLVWTDMKTENFVVTQNGDFKGIDLESAMPINGNPVDYSPEACPPEFAKAFLAGDGPYFTLQPSYDIWSFGMMCFEMATGGGYFDNKSPIQITRTLANMEEFECPAYVELDGRIKSLIEDCLQVDPRKRPSAAQVLLHPYFLTTGIGPFSF